MSIEEIGKIRKPVLWSLHDLWPMAGVDAYPENDWYKTGYPKSALWIDRWVWIRKKKAIQKASVSAVVASQWLLREVQTSLAFAGQRVYHVPLALHPCYIVPSANDMTIRTGDDRCIILFGSTSGVKSRVKGFDRLSRALSLVSEAIRPYLEVSVFGSTGEDFQIAGVPVHFLGPVPSPEMPAVFRKADIFAFPSRYETCGQVKLEALACGVPVVAFDESACAEEILHRETGWVAAPGDCADFARGIEWAYAVSKNPAQRMMCSAKARESMIRLHAPEAVAQKMIEVYKHVLAKQ